MLVVRPVATSDHAEILALAKEAGIGMTSLPPDSEVLEQKILPDWAERAGGDWAERWNASVGAALGVSIGN